MLRIPATWREPALDVGAALFGPVVLILLFNDVVATNVRELLYQPPLVRGFLLAVGGAACVGVYITRRWGGRFPARLWVAMPWALLLFDAAAAAVDRPGVPVALAATADVVVLLVVLGLAARISWPALRTVAAIAAVALSVQAVASQMLFLRSLTPNLIAGGVTEAAARPVVPPSSDAPGNVYHILLDNYLSESFDYLTHDSAAQTFPGFTYYTRFNTNFPRTSSSELALIHGRPPQPGVSIQGWPDRALREGFWSDLTGEGVGLWLYPYGRYLCPEYALQCLASTDLEAEARASVTRSTTIRLWAWRLVPTSVRRLFEAADAGAVTQELPTQYFNLQGFDRLLADEARRPARGQYVYYHALIPHPPYILDEHCQYVKDPTSAPEFYWPFARCANRMVERLAAELSRLGRLEDALIIVHADHGDMEFLLAPKVAGRGIEFAVDEAARRYQPADETYSDVVKFFQLHTGDSAAWRSIAVEVFSSGLLLVKHPGARSYSEDARPVQLLDIAPTVLSHFGAGTDSYPGSPLQAAPAATPQVFFAHNREFTDGLSRYRLDPERGWQFTDRVPTKP